MNSNDLLCIQIDEMCITMALKKSIDPPPIPKLEPSAIETPTTTNNRNQKQVRRDQEC